MTKWVLARTIFTFAVFCCITAALGLAGPAAAKPKFAAITIDAKTGKVLFSRNADSHRYPASLTKVMTLYILFQEMKAGRIKKNTRLLVSKYASKQQPSKLGLKAGSWITAENAIKALVTKSANDVAVVVAESIGGTQKAFARRMTRTAKQLGMTRSRFRNASGLPNGSQVTTARDMATLGLRIQRDFPQYYSYFKIRKFVYKGRTYRTHNKLLGRYKGTDGIKTGYIRASGFNLTSSVKRDGRHLIGVVMGAKSGRSRNKYMQKMLTKAFKRVPKRSSRALAPTAGRPPGLKKTQAQPASPGLITSPPVPAPKPLTTQTANAPQSVAPPPTIASTLATVPAANGLPAIPAPPAPSKFAAPIEPILIDMTKTAQQSAAATAGQPVVQPAAQDLKRPAAKPSTWSIQIGAYATENDAKQRLTSMQKMGLKHLSGKNPFTVAFEKKNKVIYRARFDGFDRKSARKTCRALKRKSISCFALAPTS